MRFVPSYCAMCQVFALLAESRIDQGTAACRECGEAARALPGESYGADDVSLFAELGHKLRDAGITPTSAAQLGAALEGRNSGPAGHGLRGLIKALPSLAILEFSVCDSPATMRKAEGMLATLLEAIASSRSQSGMMPAVGVELLKKNNAAR